MPAHHTTPTVLAGPRHPPRPVLLNRMQIQSPVDSICSFGHRVGGVLLGAGLPLLPWLIEASLSDADIGSPIRPALAPWIT